MADKFGPQHSDQLSEWLRLLSPQRGLITLKGKTEQEMTPRLDGGGFRCCGAWLKATALAGQPRPSSRR
ncbi:MAG TPA: hypothetical protein VI260_17960 [Blastocatellia bacterium]